ncbi:hypothetical protein [Yoonia sp. R2-816]|uniref:hypothetical protein n=1 Tax=Yoonia sp. R2-816 TaxID=3342638 RepID=UPI00372A4B86
MKRSTLSRITPIAIVAGLLASLAVGAPSYNTSHTAPRAVFLSLPTDLPTPQVGMTARQDPSGNWVLQLDTRAFQFVELCVPDADALPIGHAHIIRDGVKIAAAYQPVIDIGRLPPGQHRITAILRGQDHRALLGADGLISTEIVIDVPRLGNQI